MRSYNLSYFLNWIPEKEYVVDNKCYRLHHNLLQLKTINGWVIDHDFKLNEFIELKYATARGQGGKQFRLKSNTLLGGAGFLVFNRLDNTYEVKAEADIRENEQFTFTTQELADMESAGFDLSSYTKLEDIKCLAY